MRNKFFKKTKKKKRKKYKLQKIRKMIKLLIINKDKIYKFIPKISVILIFIVFISFVGFFHSMFQTREIYILDLKDLKHKHKISYNLNEEITLVSSYFQVKSKFSHQDYLNWINNYLQINSAMIFFTEKSNIQELIDKRPKEYSNKTIWVTLNIDDFYSYNNYFKEFNDTYDKDIEKNINSVPLYLVLAEKINFLKMATKKNFFHSKCFYWVDAGCFRDSSKIKNYMNNWPSTEKCYKDGRIIINEIVQHNQKVKEGLKNFDIEIYNNFQRARSVDTSIFGGQKRYIYKFFDLYYNTLKKFIKHEIFIGNEKIIFTYISYFYSNIAKLVYSGYYFHFQDYLSQNYNKQ